MNDSDQIKLPPLERYFRIIEMLAAWPDGLALIEMSRALMLPKATVHRLLIAMQRSDLVKPVNNGRAKYVLTHRVRKLANLSIDSDAVASLTKTLLEDFSKKLGETCYLCRLEGTVVRSIAIASPAATWRGYVLPGRLMQPHATAGGKAIMAFQGEDIINQALTGNISALTRFTKTDRSTILKDYEQIRQQRFATCIKEIEEELSAFAIPIELDMIGVKYSVGVLGPHSRVMAMLANRQQEELRLLAKAIAVTLGKSLI